MSLVTPQKKRAFLPSFLPTFPSSLSKKKKFWNRVVFLKKRFIFLKKNTLLVPARLRARSRPSWPLVVKKTYVFFDDFFQKKTSIF